jgi:Na+/H+ antiporter NhaA
MNWRKLPMKYKNLSLFLVVCFLTGVCTLFGSVVGHNLGGIGLFLGATIGGSLGVLVSTWLATRIKLIERSTYRPVAVSTFAGFVLAMTCREKCDQVK